MASLKDALGGMEKRVDGLITKLTSVSSNASGSSGRVNTGSNFLNNALGSFSTVPSARAEARFGMGMGMVQGAGQVASGVSQMMPNVEATMNRMTTYYGATLRASSGMSRNQVQQMTMGGMQGGMTAPGSDAMVAGYLGMRGMMSNANFGSTYQETTRAVGSAAKYLNMSNERAVAAVEGLTSGQGSGNMLRNFGILTGDLTTGKEKNQGQIFKELYGRLTSGRGVASEEQVMDSFRRGALGSTLRGSGMSEDQQQMFLQYTLERSRGNEMDLSDPESMQKLMDKAKIEGNENPNLPGYQLNTAKTGAMQDAQEQYLAGIKVAADALSVLAEAGGKAASVLGSLKSGFGMFGSDPIGAGFAGAAQGAGAIAGGAAMLALGKKGAGVASAGGLVAKAFAGAKGGFGKAGGGLAKGASKLVPGLGAVVGGMSSYGDAASGKGFDVGGAALSTLTAAGIGFAVGGPVGAGIAAAATAAGTLGGRLLGSMSGEGGGSDGQGAGTSGTAGGSTEGFWLQHPTKSARIGARYGATHSVYTGKKVWPGGHKGIDYEGSSGDPIRAAAPGKATVEQGGELGLRVKIQHSNGKYTFYCHLSGVSIRTGQEVSRGAVIGSMGNTGGKSNGVHLHFALSSTNTTGGHEDPEPYLRGGGNYLDPVPPSEDQSAPGNSPAPAGSSGTDAAKGGEDSSATTSTSNASNLDGSVGSSNISTPGSSGTSSLDGWSAANWQAGGGAGSSSNSGGEGGENALDPGLESLSTPGGLGASKRGASKAESKTVNNTVTINLSIAKGTQEEARRFSSMLKQALEDETSLKMMARK